MEQTQTPPSAPLIYTALAKANRMIGAIAKGQYNQGQKFKFRGIDDVYNELHPILAECDIFIIPRVEKFEVQSFQIPKDNGKISINTYTRATIHHQFTTTDGSSVTTTTVGEAMDSGDKGMNKAMSIALKYALLQLFTIPTEEDKDPDASSPTITYEMQIESAMNALMEARTLDELTSIFRGLSDTLRRDNNIINKCQAIKAAIQQNTHV